MSEAINSVTRKSHTGITSNGQLLQNLPHIPELQVFSCVNCYPIFVEDTPSIHVIIVQNYNIIIRV